MLSKVAVLVVVSFLLVILIYSSVVNLGAFARKPVTATSCVVVKPTKSNAVYAERCCDTTTYFDNAGRPTHSATECQVCQYSGGGGLVDCTTEYNTVHPAGPLPPPSAGTEQPPGSPGNNNTNTLLPGSINKVPPSTTNALPPSGTQSGTTQTLHHKGGTSTSSISSESNSGGSGSTGSSSGSSSTSSKSDSSGSGSTSSSSGSGSSSSSSSGSGSNHHH